MTIFNNCAIEQQQLWLEIADRALPAWKLSPRALRWLGQGSNPVLKVTAEPADYVLRLHPPGSVTAERLLSELRWLRSLRQCTDLLAPYPVAAQANGCERLFLELRHGLLPPPSIAYAALFEYLPGEVKSARALSQNDVYRIGAYLGALHGRRQSIAPSDFAGPRLDWEGLFGDDSPYASGAESALLSAEDLGIFGDVARALRAPLTELAAKPDAMGLIHADLLAKNIVFQRDSIAALDFEFCAWGFFLYDLAPLLWQLRGERAGDYLALEEAMWRGYTSVRPAADGDRQLLEPFIAARQLASIRWLLANRQHPNVRDLAPQLVRARCQELQAFLNTGCLRRSTPTL